MGFLHRLGPWALLLVLGSPSTAALATAHTNAAERNEGRGAALVAQGRGDGQQEIPAEVRGWVEGAQAAYSKGDATEALRLQLKALEWVNGRPSSWDSFRAGILNNLSVFLSAVGRRQEAQAPTEEALRIYRELAKTNRAFLPYLAMALNNLGIRYSELGRRQEALAPTEEALQIRRELAKTNRAFLPDLARALVNQGNSLSELGRRQEALAPTEEAVKIIRELAKTNPAFLPDLARALNNLGIRYSELGRRQEALAPTEEAAKITRELAKTNPAYLPNVATALNNLGIRYSELGRRQEALAPTEEALRMYRELAKTNPAFLPDLARALNNLGNRYSELGRRQEALAPTEEAAKIFRELAKTNRAFLPDLARALVNQGNRYSELGRRQEALAPTEEAAKIYRELAKTNRAFLPDLAGALNNLGIRLSDLGRRQEALAPTEEVAKIFRELAKTNPAFLPDLAGALNNLGIRLSDLGRRQEALAPTEEAVKIDRELAKTNRAFLPNLARSATNLAIGHLQLANPSPALEPLREAVGSEVTYLQAQLQVVPEARRQALVGAFGARWQIPFSLAQQGETGASLALFTRLNRQGLQQDIARRQALLARATGAPRQLVDRLMVLKAELANPSLPVDRYQQILQESDRLQGELFRQQPALQPRLVQPEQVARRLPADGVLVEFQRYQSLNASAKAFDPPRYMALVLTPKGAIHAVPLGEASELEPLIQKALAKVAEVPERSDVSAEQAQQALAEVRRRLLDPLLPYGGAAKRWLISPDGEIHRVPLAALPASDGALNGPTLGETRQLQVITTGRDLLEDAPAPPSASPALVMADPAYDARLGQSAPGATPPSTRPQTRSGDDQAKRWAPLTNFKPEGEKVAELLGTSLISGAQATTTRLQRAQGPRIVHIATHGFFLPDRKEDLDPKGPFQGFTMLEMPLLEREDPQLRSGIVLAGANHPEASAEDDGRLTALEATALNLSGTQLVTLSACSTGLGSQATGEGVYGLQRSLRVAGARATLLSLWEVDDAATKAFMVNYYTLLKQGMGRAEALRLVQSKLRDHAGSSHPHYWAAWQLSGDSGAVPGDPSAGRGQP